MKYRFEDIIRGISKYINDEIYPGMNDWQELFARVAVGRFLDNEKVLKETILNNGFIKTFGIMDSDGMFEIDALMQDIKKEIGKKGKMEFDVLYRTITNTDLH